MNKRKTVSRNTVKKFFNKSQVMKIAKKTKFVQRDTEFDVYGFFLGLTFGALTGFPITLEGLSENLNQKISRVAIGKRFNEFTSAFMLNILAHFLLVANENKYNINIKLLNKFNNINIIDGSSWKIPKALAKIFPGYNKAGCKIQLMYDYKSGVVNLLDVTKETYNDQSYSKTLDKAIKANDLLLFDQGYSIYALIDIIASKFAYFVSRINPSSIKLYKKESEKYIQIYILSILGKFQLGQNIFEFECYAGNKNQKTKIRVFAIRMPEEIANQRRHKLKQDRKRDGKQPSKDSLELCNWGLFMTNIPKEKELDIKTIISLYQLRWSVELFFRQYKSTMKLHKTETKTNEHRLESEVLGKCIVIMFISYLYSNARSIAWDKYEKETSFEKLVKYFHRNVSELKHALRQSIKIITKQINKMVKRVIDRCQKARQKNRANTLDKILNNLNYKEYKLVIISPQRLSGLIEHP